MIRRPTLTTPPLEQRHAELRRFVEQHEWPDISADDMVALLTDNWEGSGPIRLDATLSLAELEAAGALLLGNARAVLRATRTFGIAPEVPARDELTLRMELERPFRPPGFGDLRAGLKISHYGPSVNPLHWMQALLEVAGLLERQPDGFELTEEGHRLLAPAHAGALYAHLFRTLFRRFNLACLDHWPEVIEVQDLVPHLLWTFTSALGRGSVTADTFVQVIIPHVLVSELEERAMPARLRQLIQARVLDPLADFGLLEPRAGTMSVRSWATSTSGRRHCSRGSCAGRFRRLSRSVARTTSGWCRELAPRPHRRR